MFTVESYIFYVYWLDWNIMILLQVFTEPTGIINGNKQGFKYSLIFDYYIKNKTTNIVFLLSYCFYLTQTN